MRRPRVCAVCLLLRRARTVRTLLVRADGRVNEKERKEERNGS